MIKNIGYSSKGPAFNSQDQMMATNYNSSSRESETLFWPPSAPGMHTIYRYMYSKTFIHKIKTSLYTVWLYFT